MPSKSDLRTDDMAPDGGPRVGRGVIAKMGKKVRLIPTVEKIRKSDGALCRVNPKADDYDPTLYDEVATATRPKRERIKPEARKRKIEISAYTPEQLAKMSVEQIKQLPEWEPVAGKGRLRSKQEVIEAVLAAREELAKAQESKEED